MSSALEPNQMLIILLVAIALAGLLTGWFARRIIAASEHNTLVDECNAKLKEAAAKEKSLQQKLNASEVEIGDARKQLATLKKEIAVYDQEKDEIALLLARREKRIKSLESQVISAEDQYIKGQKDFAKMRLLKAREVQRLQQQIDMGAGAAAARTDEEDLPVLLKKAVARSSDRQPSGTTKTGDTGSAPVPAIAALPDITNVVPETEEDVFEMTSEFDFDPEELLAPFDSDSDKA